MGVGDRLRRRDLVGVSLTSEAGEGDELTKEVTRLRAGVAFLDGLQTAIGVLNSGFSPFLRGVDEGSFPSKCSGLR